MCEDATQFRCGVVPQHLLHPLITLPIQVGLGDEYLWGDGGGCNGVSYHSNNTRNHKCLFGRFFCAD
jgi:hypothetical protein